MLLELLVLLELLLVVPVVLQVDVELTLVLLLKLLLLLVLLLDLGNSLRTSRNCARISPETRSPSARGSGVLPRGKTGHSKLDRLGYSLPFGLQDKSYTGLFFPS